MDEIIEDIQYISSSSSALSKTSVQCRKSSQILTKIKNFQFTPTRTALSTIFNFCSDITNEEKSNNDLKKKKTTPFKSIPSTPSLCGSDKTNDSLINQIKHNQLKSTLFKTQSTKTGLSLFTLFNNKKQEPDLSNTKDIKDFYEYTEECMKTILLLNSDKRIKSKIDFKFNFSKQKRIAVFDLDETLMHYLKEKTASPTNLVTVTLPSKAKTQIEINIRPLWKELMQTIKDVYHIVIFTASHSSYANAVIDYLDPDNAFFSHRLYRNNCIEEYVAGQKIYIKDLDIFEKCDLKDIVLIDNSVLSCPYHLDNYIPILPYYDSENDIEFTWLGQYLLHIDSTYEDLREGNREEMQIGDFLNQIKLQVEDKYVSSEDDDNDNDTDDIIIDDEEVNNNNGKSKLLSEKSLNMNNIVDDNKKIVRCKRKNSNISLQFKRHLIYLKQKLNNDDI